MIKSTKLSKKLIKFPKNFDEKSKKEILEKSFTDLKYYVGKKVHVILLPEKPNTLEIRLSGMLMEENLGRLGKIYEVNNKSVSYVAFSVKNIESVTISKKNTAIIHLKL